MRVFHYILALLLLAAAPAGCSAVKVVRAGPEEAASVAPSGTEALVCGSIIVSLDGRERTPYGAFRQPKLTIYSVDGEVNIRSEWPGLESDGSFCWRVTRGLYVIRYIVARDMGLLSDIIQPRVAFHVPEKDSPVLYAGRLELDMTDEGLRLRVVDEYDEFMEGFRGRAPGFTGGVGKSLMVHDPRIPVEPSLASKREILRLMDGVGREMMLP